MLNTSTLNSGFSALSSRKMSNPPRPGIAMSNMATSNGRERTSSNASCPVVCSAANLYIRAVRNDLYNPFSDDAVVVDHQNTNHDSFPSSGTGTRAKKDSP